MLKDTTCKPISSFFFILDNQVRDNQVVHLSVVVWGATESIAYAALLSVTF